LYIEMSFYCDFCKKSYSTRSSLNSHQRTTKACIKIQSEIQNDSLKHTQFECEYCKTIFTLEYTLKRHIDICTHKKKSDALQEKIYIKKIKEELKTLNDRCKKQECELESYKNQIKKYEKETSDLKAIIERLASQAIKKVVNKKCNLSTFYTQEQIDNKIDSKFDDKYMIDGFRGIAQFVRDHISRDEEGRIIYSCTDKARQIFKYIDENNNEILDPKAEGLRKMIKPQLESKLNILQRFFTNESDSMKIYRENGFEINEDEYKTTVYLLKKAVEMGVDLKSINKTNKFSSELAKLINLNSSDLDL
jgi:hypothetical protein